MEVLAGRGALVALYDIETMESLVYAQRATPYAATESWNDTVCDFESACSPFATEVSMFP